MTRRAAAGAIALVAMVVGCRRQATSDPVEQRENAESAPESNPAPADHLGPGELVEGAVQLFGVALPRVMTVKASFVDVAYASGPTSVHSLAQYFRARLKEGILREGPEAATFEHVKVPGKPGLELLVRIATAADGARLEIRDATPRPAPALPDEPARWRAVGLTPQGHLADPSHLD
jgi:hypothetical protein